MKTSKYVLASQLVTTGFSPNDLAVHRKLVVKVDNHPPGQQFSQEPWRYLNEDFNWIGLRPDEDGDAIISLDDIRVTGDEKVSDKSGGNIIYQTARSGGNPSHKEISDSIKSAGYDLKSIPIALNVCKDKDGTYYELLDGRTRFQILKKMGVQNCIADLFEIKPNDQALLFGSQANNAELASGQATKEDIVNIVKNLIHMKSALVPLPFPINSIGKVKDTAKMVARQQAVDRILSASIDNLGMGNIKPADVKWIINKIIDSNSNDPLVVSFPAKKGIDLYLKSKFKIDINNDPYFNYLVTSQGSQDKIGYVVQAAVRMLVEDPSKPVGIILYHTNPGHKDSEGEWLKSTQKTVGYINQLFEDTGKVLFGGQKFDKSKVQVVGAVPQIRSLSEEFPMDKLITVGDFNKSSYRIEETKDEKEHREREEAVMVAEIRRIRESVSDTYEEAAG